MNFGSLGIANILKEALIEPAKNFKEIQVVAVASRKLSKAKEFAKSHEIKKYYGEYESLINDEDVEAVYIPLPNSLHYKWTKQALQKGKHVLCEKPLCSNGFQAFSLFELAKEKNLILLDAYHHCFHPVYKRAKEIIDGGLIGDIEELNGRFTVNIARPDIRFDFELSGGAFMDPGCYLIHALVHFFGVTPKIISTEVKTDQTDNRIDIESRANLVIEDKINVHIHSSIETKEEMQIWLEFIGKKGSLRLNNFVRSSWANLQIIRENKKLKEENFTNRSTFSFQLEEFLKLIKVGANPRLENESKKVMQLLDELYIWSDLPIRGENGTNKA